MYMMHTTCICRIKHKKICDSKHFSNLINKFVKKIFLRWVIEDARRSVNMDNKCKLTFKCQYVYYFFAYLTHKSMNPNFCNLTD